MAWTTPPTFTTGQILTASQLNVLGEDMAYLQGISLAVNPPVALGHGIESFVWRYLIVHRHNTLHCKYHITGGPAQKVNIKYNGVLLEPTPETGTSNENYNLSSLSLTVGQPYTIEIDYEISSNSHFYLDELWEQG